MRLTPLLLGWLATIAAAHAAPPPDPARMDELARSRGCYWCHTVQAVTPTVAGRQPLAPSWFDIARRYRGDGHAEDRLTQTVLSGMGRRPDDQHWRGKVGLADMPPNSYHLQPAEARELVRWVLRFE